MGKTVPKYVSAVSHVMVVTMIVVCVIIDVVLDGLDTFVKKVRN